MGKQRDLSMKTDFILPTKIKLDLLIEVHDWTQPIIAEHIQTRLSYHHHRCYQTSGKSSRICIKKFTE